MTQIGEIALWVALVLSVWGAGAAFIGGRTQRGDLVLSAERSVIAVFALIATAAIAIIAAFLGDEFQYAYVAGYSNRELSTFYKISGLWAGQPGSLVLWALMLAFFSTLTVAQNRNRNRDLMPYVAGTLLVAVGFFLAVILTQDNPFARMAFAPADGRGLNPQLQNYWMVIHPPTLYLGFTAFTVPFAFAIAALLSDRLDTRWITATRRWTLLSWFFLSCGIIFGMMWAYVELGWGGYWFWDPVENASLLPWLTATAFLHSVMIQEKRSMLKMWNMLLVIGTYLLTIFATFLTRSGLIESVHTFATNLPIAFVFLGFMGLLTIAGATLVYWRRDRFEAESQIESYLSREAAFVANNLVFVAAMFAVMWGTLFPLISEGLMGQKIAVGPPFFNRVNVPLGLILLALAGIGPVIGWRKASKRNLQRNFALPLAVGVVVGGLFWAAGVRNIKVILTFALGAFAMTTVVAEFVKGTRARAAIEKEGIGRALVHLVERNRRRYGGYVVHVGMIIIFMGLSGQAYDREVQAALTPGESTEVTSPFGHTYRLTYQDMSWYTAQNMTKLVASMQVEKDGRPAGLLTADNRAYKNRQEMNTTVGIRRVWNEDLYLILAGVDNPNGVLDGSNPTPIATFRIRINPLVAWIWTGGIILALGTLVAMWPSGSSGQAPVDTAGDAVLQRSRRERKLADA